MLPAATSCFPNCSPPGGWHGNAFHASGNMALGLAVVCGIILLVLLVRGK